MAKHKLPGWLRDQRDAANRDAALVGEALQASGDYERIRGVKPVWLVALLARHQAAAEPDLACPHVARARGAIVAYADAIRPGVEACADCVRMMIVPTDREAYELRCDGCGDDGTEDPDGGEIFRCPYRLGATIIMMTLCSVCRNSLAGVED